MSEAKKLDRAEEVLELTISYEERGKEKGKKQGLEQGLKRGLKQGQEEGKNLERKNIALNMLKKGYEIDDIHELTQLSMKQITELKPDL